MGITGEVIQAVDLPVTDGGLARKKRRVER
jgi:hypothetical protein